MAWETRNGRKVYYRSRRQGRRVVKEYFGGGDEARLAAALDAERWRQRQAEWAVRRPQGCPEWNAGSACLQELAEVCDLLALAALLVAGGYVHHGEWRLHRRGHDG